MENTSFVPNDLTKRKHFDILDGSLSCVLFIVLQYVLALIIAFTGGLTNKFLYDLFSAIMQFSFVGAVIIIAKIRKVDWIYASNFKKKIDGKIVLCALGLAVICLVLFTDITSAFMAMLEKLGYSSPLNSGKVAEYNQITNIWEYLVSIVTVCIIPPLCEETLFRGAVLNSFRGFNKWIGIFVSGFCFMIMHGNPDQTIHQFILGLILGYIAWETRNIWVCVLIHAINNFIAITITFVYSLLGSGQTGEIIDATTQVTEYSWSEIIYTLAIGIAAAVFGVFLVKKLTKIIKEKSDKLNAVKQENQEVTEQVSTQPQPVEMLVTQDGLTQKVIEPSVAEENYQKKPTKLKLALTILTYMAFAAYFINEWVGYLLVGLGI